MKTLLFIINNLGLGALLTVGYWQAQEVEKNCRIVKFKIWTLDAVVAFKIE